MALILRGGGGGGSSNANGIAVAHGDDGSAIGADGADDGGGGTGGKSKLGDGPNGPKLDPEAKEATKAGVWRLAAGAPMSTTGLDAHQSTENDPSVKVLSAWDFRNDKTGLPRYPDANQAVLSAMSYDLPGRTDVYGSSSGIITTSTFGDVVEWYRKNLPPGWSATTLGDLNRLGALAQQLSPDKIMQMLAASGGTAPVKSVAETPATPAPDRMHRLHHAPCRARCSADAQSPLSAAGGLATALGSALGGSHRVEVVDFKTLTAMLPTSLPGMKRTSAQGENQGVVGVKASSANADYQGDNGASVHIEISDMSGVSGLLDIAGSLVQQTTSESDAGYE